MYCPQKRRWNTALAAMAIYLLTRLMRGKVDNKGKSFLLNNVAPHDLTEISLAVLL